MIMKDIIPCSSKPFSVSADIAPSGFAFRDHGTVTYFVRAVPDLIFFC
jgi:hypothetical protein